MRAEDGSHLSRAADARPVRRCERCGEDLGLEQWWVTQYPHGVHTRCRDWRAVPFPFARHLELLRKMRYSSSTEGAGDARRMLDAAEAWLRRMDRAWPRPGGDGVVVASRMLRRLRARLAEEGVDARLLNQL